MFSWHDALLINKELQAQILSSDLLLALFDSRKIQNKLSDALVTETISQIFLFQLFVHWTHAISGYMLSIDFSRIHGWLHLLVGPLYLCHRR